MFDIIALIAVGIGVALSLFGLFKILRIKPPRYLMPLAVGVALVVFTVWKEYSWFDRVAEQLPERVRIIKTYGEDPVVWKPWTYVRRPVARFMAVDPATFVRNPELPGYVIAETILMDRWSGSAVVNRIHDCEGGRHADLPAQPQFGPDGLPQGVEWNHVAPDDPLQSAVCDAPRQGDAR